MGNDDTAAGSPAFYLTRFPTSSTLLRDELISRMNVISRWSRENEPGVVQYALAVPRENDDSKTAYSIERYDDDATFRAHLAAEPVANTLFGWSGKIPELFADAVEVRELAVLDDDLTVVRRRRLARTEDPFVVVETRTCQDGEARRQALERATEAAALVRGSGDNDGTGGALVFGVYGDKKEPNRLYAITAYETEREFIDSQSTISEEEGGVQSSVDRLPLRILGGFLYREP